MAKSFKGNKSRRNNSRRDTVKDQRRDSRVQKRDLSDCEGSGKNSSLNDLSWYSRNPSLLAAAGSFPFPYRPGMSLPLYDLATADANMRQRSIPGIMALDWAPSFGNSSLPTDPASIAGKEFYGRVRAAYSGSLDADAPDYMVYIGALDSIFSYIGWLKRLYRVLTTYSPDNFMLPDGLLASFGIPSWARTELRRDKVRLWQGINELILKSRKFRCPAVMDLFNRHYWMSDNIYADAATVMAQLYVFNLAGTYQLQEQTEVSSGTEKVMGLQMTALPKLPGSAPTSGEHTACDTLLEYGDSMLRKVDAWDDGYTISGYLQRAFDGQPSFAVAELLQDELATAQFVPEVLSQIENSRTCFPAGFIFRNWTTWTDGVLVTQNVATNAVVSNVNLQFDRVPKNYSATASVLAGMLPSGVAPTLSIRSDAPTIPDSVIASRLQAITDVKVAANTEAGFEDVSVTITAGTELPLAWNVILLDPMSGDFSATQMDTVNLIDVPVPGQSGKYVSMPTLTGYLSVPQFDWHPIMFTLARDAGTNPDIPNPYKYTVLIPYGDVHNITVVQKDALANLHRVCFYSEFNSFNM